MELKVLLTNFTTDKLKIIFSSIFLFSYHNLFKMLRYFSSILEIKNGQQPRDDDDYEIIGNRTFVSMEFMTEFIIDFKMYKNTGIYKLKSTLYPCTFYSLDIGLIEHVNGIFNFMIDNNYCFYDSGVLNVKLQGYKFKIVRGDNVTLELNTNKRTLH
jgi:hypothetical protein